MPQQRRKIGVEQDYPGSFEWPIYEYLCPCCNTWGGGSGTDQKVGDEWHVLCEACEEKVNKEMDNGP
jgi:hypothetical protein